MEIITISHINEQHAQSEHFAQAESADGRFRWSCGRPGYVSLDAQKTGLSANTVDGRSRSLYLQYPDPDVPIELLAEARAFSAEVDSLRERRRAARLAWELEQESGCPAAPRTDRPDIIWDGERSMDHEDSIF